MFEVRIHSRGSQAMAATVEMHLITALEKWVNSRPVGVVEHRGRVHLRQLFPESLTYHSDLSSSSVLSTRNDNGQRIGFLWPLSFRVVRLSSPLFLRTYPHEI